MNGKLHAIVLIMLAFVQIPNQYKAFTATPH
jgi:hypothetical protein